jgi:hypothetical protein
MLKNDHVQYAHEDMVRKEKQRELLKVETYEKSLKTLSASNNRLNQKLNFSCGNQLRSSIPSGSKRLIYNNMSSSTLDQSHLFGGINSSIMLNNDSTACNSSFKVPPLQISNNKYMQKASSNFRNAA